MRPDKSQPPPSPVAAHRLDELVYYVLARAWIVTGQPEVILLDPEAIALVYGRKLKPRPTAPDAAASLRRLFARKMKVEVPEAGQLELPLIEGLEEIRDERRGRPLFRVRLSPYSRALIVGVYLAASEPAKVWLAPEEGRA